jgi:hypothetical protein
MSFLPKQMMGDAYLSSLVNMHHTLPFHNFCAGKGFAPKLYGTKMSVCGRWNMIAMEALDGEFATLFSCEDQDARSKIQKQVRKMAVMNRSGQSQGVPYT